MEKLEYMAQVFGANKGRCMNKKERVKYTDNPEIGELVEISKSFLPRPEDLVFKEPATEKVTIELEKETVDFFRQKAQSLGASYQRMIRKLLSEYVAQQNHKDSNVIT